MNAEQRVTLRDAGSALTHFDMMRGVAAAAVVVGHVRGLFFLDYAKIGSKSLVMRAFYMATGLGHQAVIVFFVLSGFFIGTSVIEGNRSAKWSWRNYLLRRLTRLYVVLVPALVLTVVLDAIGMRLFGISGVYGGHIETPLRIDDVSRTSGPMVLLANLAFLQTFAGPGWDTFGSNGPLWSLSYEFWAYLFFPLVVRALVGPWRSRLVQVALAAGIVAVGGKDFILYFLIWAMGAAVAAVWPKYRLPHGGRGALATGAVVLAFVATLLAARAYVLPRGPVADIVLGIATSLLVLTLLARRGAAPATAFGKRYAMSAKELAGFSYTLYLIHYPILVFVEAAWMGGSMWYPTPRPILFGALLVVAVIVLVAYPLGRVTEGNTDKVRLWVASRIGITRDSERRAG